MQNGKIEVNSNMTSVTEGAKLMSEFMALADAESTMAEPVTQEERTIITLSEMGAGLGFGFGSGKGESPEKEGGKGSGGGGGGGGRVWARPVAAVIIENDQVRVEPVVDATKIAITFFSAFAAIFMALARMWRVKQALEE